MFNVLVAGGFSIVSTVAGATLCAGCEEETIREGPDSAVPQDAGFPREGLDATMPLDAGPPPDSGFPMEGPDGAFDPPDAGPEDGGVDGGMDGGA